MLQQVLLPSKTHLVTQQQLRDDRFSNVWQHQTMNTQTNACSKRPPQADTSFTTPYSSHVHTRASTWHVSRPNQRLPCSRPRCCWCCLLTAQPCLQLQLCCQLFLLLLVLLLLLLGICLHQCMLA